MPPPLFFLSLQLPTLTLSRLLNGRITYWKNPKLGWVTLSIVLSAFSVGSEGSQGGGIPAGESNLSSQLAYSDRSW